jgi:outer membrane immunogenic protein
MKRILVGAALVGTAMNAHAADLPVKAQYYKAPAAAVYNWTGFYIGVNAGVGLGRDRSVLNAQTTFNSTYLSPQGALGGGQIGYNWQTDSLLGPMVLGVEADIQGTGMSDSGTSLPIAGRVQYDQKLDWFGTVRGRVGLAHGPVLSYVTAGYAYGSVNTSITEFGTPAFSSGNRMQNGWTVGSGVEAALGGNWTGKIEYLYLDLGNKTDSFTALAVPQTLNTEIRENIFRAGLNYRIGGNSTYAPAVTANWSGFYLGGNLGSGTGRDRSSFVGSGANEFFNLAPDGVNGGVQAGYNWQAANWVYGLEIDFQGSSQKDDKTCIITCTGQAMAYDATLPWFGTVRGRLGYSLGSTLFYVTGGYAYGDVKTKITGSFGGTTLVNSLSSTKSGWTAGGGIETPFTLLGMFGPNWTTKTEYLYVDLGSTSDPVFGGAIPPAISTTHVTEHIFRTGLNYHFNSPVVAKY